MPLVHSLKSIAIGKFHPEQMSEIIKIMENLGYDFEVIIKLDLETFNRTLIKMVNFNKDYDGWWDTPYRIAAFTTNPEYLQNRQ